ncbi:MAG: hypothetical protein ACD_71C00160G0004 [uncultured bacterium (gcode 4)]|uniref:S-adenosyl-l-methionine hydroxide adenosyltransferase C-terminal domain-containing protein n=1 Tax=uncultured bacterium (gcode 4) TaxID=1234023 RepID=K1ZIW5_9BACT|nr:MAG: hypothetical protein ACD_71C00160G0004 [uncultured bacterium (gcode 4)]
MTPAAIEIAKNNFSIFGDLVDEAIITIDKLNDTNVIIYIDNFGNIKTNILASQNSFNINSVVDICINNRKFKCKFLNTFSEVGSGELICYVGSNQTLEIAVNLGSAKDVLSAVVGESISIELAKVDWNARILIYYVKLANNTIYSVVIFLHFLLIRDMNM